jgi:hypothetical protein
MKLADLRSSFLLALLVIALSWAGAAGAQSVAGTVDFIAGPVEINGIAAPARIASRGAAVLGGDTIATGQGRVQLRMIDGAYISLQPQSVLRLDEYSLASAAKEESGLLALLRGGLRTVTGLIGKTNRNKYRLITDTATIGIRGTEFAATADHGTRVNVTRGIVALCNNGGCIDIAGGQSGFAASRDAKPVLSFSAASLPPVAKDAAPSFIAAERRDGNGNSLALADTSATAPVIPLIPLANGGGGFATASVTTGGSFSAGLLGGTMTFAGGALTQSIDCCTPANNYTGGVSSEFGADGIIAWGRWTSGVGQNGQPLATMNYVAVLAANNVTAGSIVRGYAAFASTAPTVTSGGSIVATGTPNTVSGSLTVNFANLTGGGSLSYALSIPVASQTFSIVGNAAQYSGTGFLGTSSTITSTGAGCTPSCTGSIPYGDAIQGVFTGASAQRAGANYGFSSQLGKVSGAVVFH